MHVFSNVEEDTMDNKYDEEDGTLKIEDWITANYEYRFFYCVDMKKK